MAQVGTAVQNQLSGGLSFTLTKNVVATNNTLLCEVSGGMGSGGEPTITDSAGQTWTKDKSSGLIGSLNTTASIWRLTNANTGTHTLTVSGNSGTSYMVGTLEEWAGLLTPNPVDTLGAATNNSTTNVTSGNSGTTGTTAQASELAVAAICVNPPGGTSNDGLTTPSGWTNQQLYTNTTVTVGASHITKELSSTGTQSATWAWSESSNYAAVLQTYKYASGTSTDVNCALGAVSAAGLTALVQLPTNANCSLASVADVGQTASIQLPTAVNCSLGAAVIAGQTATVQTGNSVNCTLGQVAMVGLSASVLSATNIPAAVGGILSSGLSATIQTGTSITAASASVFVIGLPANVRLDVNVGCALARMTVSGLTASVTNSGTAQNALPSHIYQGLPRDSVYKGMPQSRIYVGLPE